MKKDNSEEILINHNFSTWNETCKWKQESEKIILSHKTVPWFLVRYIHDLTFLSLHDCLFSSYLDLFRLIRKTILVGLM